MFNDSSCSEKVENSFPAILKSANAFESRTLESCFLRIFSANRHCIEINSPTNSNFHCQRS